MKRFYLAGPMRGYPEFNFPAFHAATTDLRARGFEVWSPAERDEEEDGFDPKTSEPRSLREYMLHDLPAVLESDAVTVLDGWEQSQGATLEVHVARTCGIPVVSYPSLDEIVGETPERHPNSRRFHSILRTLGELHDRKQRDYGRGDDPFANVRASEQFGAPGWIGCLIRANDKMTRLQTAARQLQESGRIHLSNEGVEDSLQDLAVYAVIGLVLFEESLPLLPPDPLGVDR